MLKSSEKHFLHGRLFFAYFHFGRSKESKKKLPHPLKPDRKSTLVPVHAGNDGIAAVGIYKRF